MDFGALTRQLVTKMSSVGTDLYRGHKVGKLSRDTDGRWEVHIKDLFNGREFITRARFVFIGAGGGTLELLQSSGIVEVKGFGGFPISGQFLRATNPDIIDQHHAKV